MANRDPFAEIAKRSGVTRLDSEAIGERIRSQRSTRPGPLRSLAGRAGSVGGRLLDVLNVPQQAAFRTFSGLADIAQGEVGAGLGNLGRGLQEVATLGGAPDITFSEVLTPADERREGQVRKLPRGLETAAQLVLDPLNVVSFGATGALRTGAQAAARGGASQLGEQILLKGARTALKTPAAEQVFTSSVARAARQAGVAPRRTLGEIARGVEKGSDEAIEAFAERTLRRTVQADQGGLVARIPGTSLGRTLASPDQLAKAKNLTGVSQLSKIAKNLGPVRAVRRALSPNALRAERLGNEVSGTIARLTDDAKTKLDNFLDDADIELTQAVNKVGDAWDDDAAATVLLAMESGDDAIQALAAASPEFRPVLDAATRVRARRLDVLSTHAPQILEDSRIAHDRYMRRVLSAEAKKRQGVADPFLAETIRAAGGPPGGRIRLDSATARKIFPKATAKQANELLMKKQAKAIAKGKLTGEPFKWFEEDALKSLQEMNLETARVTAQGDWVDGMRRIRDDIDGSPIMLDPDEFAALKKAGELPEAKTWIDADFGDLGTFKVHPALREDVKRISGRIMTDEVSIKNWVQGLDSIQRIFKLTATLPLVGGAFFLRNFRSNQWLNLLSGMSLVDLVAFGKRARTVQRQVSKIRSGKLLGDVVATDGFEAAVRQGLNPSDFAMWKAARERGIFNTGFFEFEVVDDVARGGRLGRAEQAVARNRLIQSGAQFNSALENNARFAQFMFHMERTAGDADQAALLTKRFLFDYSELSEFEKRVLKRAIPFYTFMRKNLPIQLREGMLRRPQLILAHTRLGAALTEELDERERGKLPGFLEDTGARRLAPQLAFLAGGADTPSIIPDNPFFAATETLTPAFQAAGAVPGLRGLVPESFRDRGLSDVLQGGAEQAGGPIVEAVGAALGGPEFGRTSSVPEPLRIPNAFLPVIGRTTRGLSEAPVLGGEITERLGLPERERALLPFLLRQAGIQVEDLNR